MSTHGIAFTYEDHLGDVGQIDLQSMRKLWVDHDRAGIVFAEATADGHELLHEVVVSEPGTTDAMVAVMESLLTFPSLQQVDAQSEGLALVLEFRAPRPQVVALIQRSS